MSDRQDKKRLSMASRRPPARWTWLIGWFVLLAWADPSGAQPPLYEQRPFDRITLDEASKGVVLDVQPLDEQFPDRKLPEKFPSSGKFLVKPINEPGTQYECYWRSVAKIELFEQLILNEVNGLVAAKRFEDAYQYFVQLENEKPDLPGLRAAFDNYLFEEAKAFHIAGQYDAALARLRELYSQSPKWPNVERALGSATAKLVEKAVSEQQYWIARDYLDNLAKAFPTNDVATTWRTHLRTMAEKELADARRAIEDGRFRDAQAHVRQIAAIWPELAGAEDVRKTLAARYPRYVVAVESLAKVREAGSLDDWASRRSARLVERTLLEFAGPGTEGGKYVCPVGEMTAEELGRRLAFRLRDDIPVSGGDGVLTGYDLSRQFLAMAAPGSPQYSPLWYDLFESVSVKNVFTTVVELRRPFVLPQALLQTPIATPAVTFGGKKAGATIGPYFAEPSEEEGESVYLTNTSYFAGAGSRPKEIAEHRYATGDEMVRALRRGDVDVVDRLNLWELDKYRALSGVVVKRYAVPLVHCLIPNPKRPLSSRRAFRRALVYGINREAILNLLVRNQQIPGCQVISGPFSAGVTTDDPLDYAYDTAIEPRSYEPHLAVVLAEVAFKEYVEAEKEKGETVKAVPETILGYPPSGTARMAVRQIQRQLKLLGIEVTLRELDSEALNRIPEDVDLLYAELAMWEPIVDAERLLGDDGVIGEASPYMRLALRQLRQSVDWPTIGRQLRAIHSLAHSEVTIIPLWQLSDYFAHVRDLEGLGDSPVTLYQHVEEWRANNSQATSKKP